jgi:polyisoprenoid-binding protein YceI
MKQALLPLLAAVALMSSCGQAPTTSNDSETTETTMGAKATIGVADGLYVINKVKPKVTWAAQKLTGDGHDGTLYIESGKFKVENGNISDGVVIFDMTKIAVSDLEGEDKASLEGHLRSGDFFNVEAEPKAILKVHGIATEGEQNVMNGTLTMNGQAVDYSIPVQLVEAEVPGDVKGLSIQGKFNLDRTKHNITYHSQTFNDKLDWFIKDDVAVGFSVIGTPAN